MNIEMCEQERMLFVVYPQFLFVGGAIKILLLFSIFYIFFCVWYCGCVLLKLKYLIYLYISMLVGLVPEIMVFLILKNYYYFLCFRFRIF